MKRNENQNVPAHQKLRKSINSRLRNAARERGIAIQDVRKQYIFAIFLRQLFSPDDGNWLVLGGNALLIRIGHGRYTRDIDLADKGSLGTTEELRQELEDLTPRRSFEDGFRFVIKRVTMQENTDEYGYGTHGARADVLALLGAQRFEEFAIDIVPQRHISTEVEHLSLEPVIVHESLKNLPSIPVVPLENHLADKICAMYEMHGDSYSTRLRDLADTVRIVQQLAFDAATLIEKLQDEARRRKMMLPSSLVSPGPSWEHGYPQAARTYAGFPKQYHSLDASLAFAGRCLNPLLSGRRTAGTWDPTKQLWIDE